ncbi:unnamed protein product [Cunninghamella echinulata]
MGTVNEYKADSKLKVSPFFKEKTLDSWTLKNYLIYNSNGNASFATKKMNYLNDLNSISAKSPRDIKCYIGRLINEARNTTNESTSSPQSSSLSITYSFNGQTSNVITGNVEKATFSTTTTIPEDDSNNYQTNNLNNNEFKKRLDSVENNNSPNRDFHQDKKQKVSTDDNLPVIERNISNLTDESDESDKSYQYLSSDPFSINDNDYYDTCEWKYMFETSFDEIPVAETTKTETATTVTDLDKNKEWENEYKSVYNSAKQGTINPNDMDSRLKISGIFKCSNMELSSTRLDLPLIVEKNIKLLKRSIHDKTFFKPEPANNLDELYLNHILTDVYLNHSTPPPMTNRPTELDFISKSVSFFVNSFFSSSKSKVYIDWDSTSWIYKQKNIMDKKKCRPDILFKVHLDNGNTIEVGNGEIKPPKTRQDQITMDRIRIIETAKRQLHLRLLHALTEKELFTFGMMVAGYKIELYAVFFKNGFYGYKKIEEFTLPTHFNTYSLMDEALEFMLSFKNAMESTVDHNNNLTSPSPSSLFLKMEPSLLPTVNNVVKMNVDMHEALDK